MRAAVIDGFGGPERLAVRDVVVPPIDSGDVLIAIDTAGVGVWDIKARRGDWARADDRFPMVLGADGSGTIAALGDGVRGLQLGDAVYGYAYGDRKGGFYAEYVVLRAEHVAPMPPSLDFREAGALGVSGVTALAGIDALALAPGQTVIVHGATGAVGTVAVQLAKRAGARVVATANGGAGRDLLRRLGADDVVDSQHEDVADAVRRLAPAGADALLALAGGPALERCAAALRDGAAAAYPHGVEPPRTVASIAFDGVPDPAAFARLNAIVGASPIEMPIAAMFSLEHAADAHRRLERGHVLGRIVLVVDAREAVEEMVA